MLQGTGRAEGGTMSAGNAFLGALDHGHGLFGGLHKYVLRAFAGTGSAAQA